MPPRFPLHGLLVAALPLALVISTPLARSQSSWQSAADLASSGAAAHIAVHHICNGSAGSSQASTSIEPRLRRAALDLAQTHGSDATSIQTYMVESTNRKIRAFLASNRQRACGELDSLVNIAAGAGFPLQVSR